MGGFEWSITGARLGRAGLGTFVTTRLNAKARRQRSVVVATITITSREESERCRCCGRAYNASPHLPRHADLLVCRLGGLVGPLVVLLATAAVLVVVACLVVLVVLVVVVVVAAPLATTGAVGRDVGRDAVAVHAATSDCGGPTPPVGAVVAGSRRRTGPVVFGSFARPGCCCRWQRRRQRCRGTCGLRHGRCPAAPDAATPTSA